MRGSHDELKSIARTRLSKTDTMLRRWWCKKYSLPPTSDEFSRYTFLDLWLEFYEDYLEENKDEAAKTMTKSGDVQFVTGDTQVDKLEELIAEGNISQEEITAILESWTKKKSVINEAADTIGDGFEDLPPNR